MSGDKLGPLTRFMYVTGSREQKGPALVAEMRRLVEIGVINEKSLVWTNGMGEWKAMGDVHFLAENVLKKVQAVQVDSEPGKSNKKKKKRKKGKGCKAVYVTKIPIDADEEEIAAHFAKCGILEKYPLTGKPIVKLYTDAQGKRKGDGVVEFGNIASVDLAISILDQAELRLGKPETTLGVVQATNQPSLEWVSKKSQNSDTLERALKLRKLEKEQALSWNEQGVGDSRGLKLVVLKNLFSPSDPDVKTDEHFKSDLEADLREECGKLGEVKKVIVFEEHPEGVAIIKFRSARSAEMCIDTMNGRWFAKRQIDASFWDGTTDYRSKLDSETQEAHLESLAATFEMGG
uniref:RRM domain-containing protein n=1 Tax=Mucochytrium quahogii TaxID=96639 RepID=A0A7S2S574_9STRA|mmetsp:Transcript_15626/g.27242  ORF Transcript_15626/g.27242 Transcript_15626/m.27242 type:complete len:347 (+) Transcript_15626:1708-2748(+)